jgi:protein SCO1
VKLVTGKLGLKFVPAENRDGHAADLVIGNVAAGQWMRNSAVDNARFLATTIGNFVDRYGRPGAVKSYAAAAPITLRSPGEYLFATRCAACHSIGRGDGVGPDLLGVTRRRERGWLTRYLAHPERMLADGDPIAMELFQKYKQVPMPNLRLGEEDVAALVAYLDVQPAAADAPDRAPP